MMNPLTLINYVPYVNMHHDPWLFIQIEITPMNNVAFTDKQNMIILIIYFFSQ